MKKWFLVLLASAWPCMVNAWELCCPSSWCFDASIGIEALYWKPYADDFAFGEQVTATPVHREVLDLEIESGWGFRLFANVSDKRHCNFLDFEWARVTTSNSDLVEPQAGFTLTQYTYTSLLNFNRTSINAKEEVSYQKFSARLGHRFCGDECRFLYGYLGGRWIYINVKENSAADAIAMMDTFLQQRSWFHGGGVEAGVGAHAQLWCGFGTSIRMGAIGALGDRGFSHEANQLTVSAFLEDVSSRCVAGFEGRAELNYTYFCKCFWIQGQVGYEINYYLNPLLFGSALIEPGSLFSSDFGIGGLVLGITVGY